MTTPHHYVPVIEEPEIETQELAAHALWLMKAGLFVGGLVFFWFKLSGTNFIPIAHSVPADILFQVTMALYGAAWFAGLSHDITIQIRVFEKPPKRQAALFIMYGAGFAITAAFLFLCAAGSSPRFLPRIPVYPRFSVALASLWVLNIAFWYLAVRYVWRAAFRANRDHYKQERRLIQLERLIVVERYLIGSWQWGRFLAGAGLIAVMAALSLSNSTQRIVTSWLDISPDLLIALSIFTFVAIVEASIWFRRIQVDALLKTLRNLSLTYVLIPKPEGAGSKPSP